MCLNVEVVEKSMQQVKALKAKNKPIIAYSLKQQDSKGGVGSVFYWYDWEKGINKALGGGQTISKMRGFIFNVPVDEGSFHFVRTLKAVDILAKEFIYGEFKEKKVDFAKGDKLVAIRVKIDPKDLVAIGKNDMRGKLDGTPAICAKRAFWDGKIVKTYWTKK